MIAYIFFAALVAMATALWTENTYSDELLEKAQGGDIEAQFNLALCYQTGEGIGQNMDEAFKWYTKAAEQGHAEAAYILRILFKGDDPII